MYFRNLEAELKRQNFTREKVAVLWHCSFGTASKKLSGKAPITLNEAFELKNKIAPKIPVEELFEI